jgi:prepilin-type processing-associated H-X9-DG protein
LYLDDYRGVYPYQQCFPTVNPKGIDFWFDALSRTLPNAKWGEGVFKCPVYTGLAYEGGTKFTGGALRAMYAPCGSYAYNAVGRPRTSAGEPGFFHSGLGFTVYEGQPMERPVRETDVKNPANLYAFGDAPLVTAEWGPSAARRLAGATDYSPFLLERPMLEMAPHSGVFNMLFADLHTESVRTNVLLSAESNMRKRWNRNNLP